MLWKPQNSIWAADNCSLSLYFFIHRPNKIYGDGNNHDDDDDDDDADVDYVKTNHEGLIVMMIKRNCIQLTSVSLQSVSPAVTKDL